MTKMHRLDGSVPDQMNARRAPALNCSTDDASSAVLAYIAAFIIGIAAVLDLLPIGTILGTGGLWVIPGGDLAENLTGHLAFQNGGWHWPLLLAPDLAWPHGTSIAMTDSNPLISLFAKISAGITGAPVNALGEWLALCWLLQPVAAIYALRGFGCRSLPATITAAIFAAYFPALLFRVGHINLCGQFLLLLAIGVALRMLGTAPLPSRRWWVVGVLLTVAILCHPYLYLFSGLVCVAPAMQAMLDRRSDARRSLTCCLVAVVFPVLLYWTLSGTLGGADRGFGYYSMNLLSPVWPQQSGIFGPDLPIIDATGGQYEGFNYFGAGGLLLLAISLILWLRRGGIDWRRWRAFALVLIGLTLLSLSTKIYAGHWLFFSLGVKPWDQIFGIVQSSGRAFWVVGYALILAAIATVDRGLRSIARAVVLSAAVVLQLVDTSPLRAAAQSYFAGHDQRSPPIPILAGAHWLRLVPVCTQPGNAAQIAGKLRLEAVRRGVVLRDMRVSRLPHWFNCESALTDGTELPLLPHEMRVFLEPPATTMFRQAALGADEECRGLHGMIVCARDLPLNVGTLIGPGPGLPTVPVPSNFTAKPAQPDAVMHNQSDTLDPLLSFGWKRDSSGVFWSEGPRATLLFRAAGPPNTPLLLRLTLAGIAQSAGGVRPIEVRIGTGPISTMLLQDGKSAVFSTVLPPASIPDGVIRIAIDINHPIDPRKRHLEAPVSRAGVQFRSLYVQAAE